MVGTNWFREDEYRPFGRVFWARRSGQGLPHFREGVVPRSLHFKTPNTAVDWSSVTIVTEKENLGTGAVGVSSFGFGGALGHVVVTGKEKRSGGGRQQRRVGRAARGPFIEFIKSDLQTHKSLVAT